MFARLQDEIFEVHVPGPLSQPSSSLCFTLLACFDTFSGGRFVYVIHSCLLDLFSCSTVLLGNAGEIPEDLGKLSALQMLRLADNKLTGMFTCNMYGMFFAVCT